MIEYRILPVTPFQQNCSIVWCSVTRRAAVIDPGGEVERIIESCQTLGVTVERILLTHGHIDHAGGAKQLAARLSVPIEGPHQADDFWIQGMPSQSRMFGFPDVEAFEPQRWLVDGDNVMIGEARLEVIHAPGHTPGHVVFFHPETRMAWVGDVLFAGSIGRTDFPQGDQGTLIDSIRRKLFPLGDDVSFIPGHGPGSDFLTERQHNPYVGERA